MRMVGKKSRFKDSSLPSGAGAGTLLPVQPQQYCLGLSTMEPPFPFSYSLLLQKNLWKWKHSHEGTVEVRVSSPSELREVAPCGTCQLCVEALLPLLSTAGQGHFLCGYSHPLESAPPATGFV